MTTEIERKFLLDGAPHGIRLGDGQRLRQGYLAHDGDTSVRVRIADRTATLTVKAGLGLARTEVELPISTEQAEVLWSHTVGRRIIKTRYRIALHPPAGVTAEVDEYAEALAGLWTVEVEFDAAATAETFVPPHWFGREVTGHRAWTNAALARHGPPPGAPSSSKD